MTTSTGSAHRGGWVAVSAHAVVAGLTQLLWLTYAPIATEAGTHLAVSTGAIGWLTNVFPLIYVLLAIPAGLALDRWPARTMWIGTALVAAGAALRVLADDYAGALAGQILISIAQPILLGGVAVIAATRLPEASRPAGIAVGSAGVFGGLLLGIAMPSLFDGEHIDGLLLTQAGLAIAGALAMIVAVGRGASGVAAAGATGAGAHHESIRELLRDPFQRTLLALSAGGFGAFVALLTWLQALLEPAGISEDTSGGLLLLLVTAGLITTAFVPAAVVARRAEGAMLRAALPVAGAACLILAVAPPLAVVAIALAVVGALLLPALPVMLELAEQHAGASSSGAASALIWLAGNLGGFVMALAVQLVLDAPAAGFALIALATFAISATAGRRVGAQLAARQVPGPAATRRAA